MTATKGARSRERILTAALALFAERGYEATSMRDVAARAECAVGLLYRYFPRREAFVIELYRRQAAEAEAHAGKLRGVTLGARFAEATHARVARMRPYREAFRAFAGAGLDRRSGVAVLGEETRDVRESAERALRIVIAGAADRPPPPLDETLVRPLFVLQLLCAVALTQDDSRGARKTRALVDATADGLQQLGPLLPFTAPLLVRVDGLIASFERGR